VGINKKDSREAACGTSNQFARCSWPYRQRDVSMKISLWQSENGENYHGKIEPDKRSVHCCWFVARHHRYLGGARTWDWLGPLAPTQRIEELLGIPDETDVKAAGRLRSRPWCKAQTWKIGETKFASAGSSTGSPDSPWWPPRQNITGVFGPAVTWAHHSDSRRPVAGWQG